MKKSFLVLPLFTLIIMISLSACSSNAPRINPGHLDVSQNVATHSAKITNIIQLSEKEAHDGKVMLGAIAGMLIADAFTKDQSDLVQYIAADLGGDIGKSIVVDNYGKIIYKLTLELNSGLIKHIHVRGGTYVVGRHAKITVDKTTGAITSLVAL